MNKILTNAKGNIRLDLREDRLSAWLTILDQNNLLDEQEILDLIEQAGIKTGFEEALKYMRKHGLEKEYNASFPIAICNYVKGETKLNYYFDLQQAKLFDGKVRSDEMAELTCVEAGTILADYNSNIFDRQGSIYDIYGEMINDADLDLAAIDKITGDNVTFSEEKGQFVAKQVGFPCVDDQGRISIISTLILSGDISSQDGLRSPVDLEIRGSVDSTKIVVAGNVVVDGELKSSEVYCEGDLNVKGEILECRQPGLEILGNVSCMGMVNSRVLCRGRIAFQDRILNCEAIADGGISSTAGIISGGRVESSSDIIVGKLGDPDGNTTEVEITISPFHKALLTQLTRELIHQKQDPGNNEEAIEALNRKIQSCERELDNDLNNYLKRSQTEKLNLVVSQEVYPPLQIRILKHEYTINNIQTHLEITEKD